MCRAARSEAVKSTFAWERSKMPMNAHWGTAQQQEQEQRHNSKPFITSLVLSNRVGTKGGFFLKEQLAFPLQRPERDDFCYLEH